MKKIMIINSVVTIPACIDLFRIFLQTRKNILYPWKGFFYRWKRKINTIFQNNNRQIRTLVYDITKSRKINITRNVFFSSLTIYMCSLFCLCLFHTSILDNWVTTWILSIIDGSIFFMILAEISIVFPE